MNRTSVRLLVSLFIAVSFLVGCEEKNSATENAKVAAKAEAEARKGPQRPTTQELLTGPRKRINVTPLPFSANVPLSWKVESLGAGSIIVLTGPSPSGEAQIQLANRSTAKKEELEIIQRAAKKELTQPATDSVKRTVKVDFRKLGDVEVFERQAVGLPGPLTTTDAQGIEHTETATPYTWTVMLFVPQGSEYARYEMNFIGLTAEQYKQDKQLLDAIMATLQY